MKRIVLTGGPGAGKTAVLEIIRQHFPKHVLVLPEAASLLFRGGFPRGASPAERRAAQRAIFFVQRELERWADAADGAAVVLCDRGTVDGLAYWPGPARQLWREVGSSRARELTRYDVVLHLRTPTEPKEYNHHNPFRVEPMEKADAIDRRIARAWQGHPRRFFVDSRPRFLDKAAEALALIRSELSGGAVLGSLPGDA